MTRFPPDFMFEMTTDELQNWRSQNVTSNSDKRGLRYAPFCFTEQGVAMLSSVLNSETAIQVNIQIVRIFTHMREMVLGHKDILLHLEKLERKLSGHDNDIRRIFNYLKQLLTTPSTPRRRIGFKPDKD